MSRKVIDVTRRQVLRGIGGTVVALPFLPSLLPGPAYGADPVLTRTPRLFWITTNHGGAYESNMFPSQSLLTNSQALFSDHTVRSGTLVPTTSGSDSVLSPILRAPSSDLSSTLISKMNVLYGLDVPFYIAHNTGMHLGNYARNDGNGGDGIQVQNYPRPTIDQIMAWSSSFYPSLAGIKERAIIMGRYELSWNYSDPSNLNSSINNIQANYDSLDIFEKIFTPSGSTTTQRTPIVDRVMANYKRLRNGNTRLSAADKQRLDDHIARIDELQRKLTVTVASCSNVVAPTDTTENHHGNSPAEITKQLQLYNEVAAIAFMCGTSRICVLGVGDTSRFVSYGGDWHENVAHQWQLPDPQNTLTTSYQKFFAGAFVDMAKRLNVDEGGGYTYLDNSLLVWTQESGMETHGSASVPVVTFGGAAGAMKTGQFIDFRRMGNAAWQYDPGAGGKQTLGVLYSQWLATVLQAMRLQPSEFERWGYKGYGYPYITKQGQMPPFKDYYGDTNGRYFTMASNWLPFLKA